MTTGLFLIYYSTPYARRVEARDKSRMTNEKKCFWGYSLGRTQRSLYALLRTAYACCVRVLSVLWFCC